MNMNSHPNPDDPEIIRTDLNICWAAMQQIIDWASPCSHHSRDAEKIPSLNNYKGEERNLKAQKWYSLLLEEESIERIDHLLKVAAEVKAKPETVAVCLQKIFGSMRNSAKFDGKAYFDGMMEGLSRGPYYSAYALLEATAELIETETFVPSIAHFMSKVRTHHSVLHYKMKKLDAFKALKHEIELHLKSTRPENKPGD